MVAATSARVRRAIDPVWHNPESMDYERSQYDTGMPSTGRKVSRERLEEFQGGL